MLGRDAVTLRMRFDRGTLELDTSHRDVPGAVLDPRSHTLRAAACALGEITSWADREGLRVEGDPRAAWTTKPPASLAPLGLRPYQVQALGAWEAAGRRGVVVLPTGAGKTRVAIAAMRDTGLPAAVLCPTRALASAWVEQLAAQLEEPIGMMGDGRRRAERVTVMTFESAFRCMDELGDRFGLLVVDEVHHFAAGRRIEALEACVATARLGLTATAPPGGTAGSTRLEDLVGPVVFEVSFGELVGTHLAPLRVTRIAVRLEPDERAAYEKLSRAFRTMSAVLFRASPGLSFPGLVAQLAATLEGRRALRDHHRALELAGFPRAKRAIVRDLLLRHRDDRTIVFTALAENAYDVARENLVPVIAAETSRAERTSILERFQQGTIRAVASARVLNEGIDVPEAKVAIVVAGALGEREHVQRIGRVLRPSPGKEALVYELVTSETADARRAAARRKQHVARPTHPVPRA